MGETGPCGPCSEIHLDRGPDACDMKGRRPCMPGQWRLRPLYRAVEFGFYPIQPRTRIAVCPNCRPNMSIPAWALERITAVLQNVLSNYDIDFMRALTATTEKLTGKKYGADPVADISFRVIDDHARAVSFLIADGVMPSNEGRGYVLRRLLQTRRPPWPFDRPDKNRFSMRSPTPWRGHGRRLS